MGQAHDELHMTSAPRRTRTQWEGICSSVKQVVSTLSTFRESKTVPGHQSQPSMRGGEGQGRYFTWAYVSRPAKVPSSWDSRVTYLVYRTIFFS